MESLYFLVLLLLLAGWIVVRPARFGLSIVTLSGQLLCASMISLFNHQLVAYRFWNVARIGFLAGALGLSLLAQVYPGDPKVRTGPHTKDPATDPMPRTWRFWVSAPMVSLVAVLTITLILITNAALREGHLAQWSTSGRWIATATAGSLLATRMSLLESRRLLTEFFGLYLVAMFAAITLVPSRAFDPIRSPLLNQVLVAPHLGGRVLPAVVAIAALIVGLSSTKSSRFVLLLVSIIVLVSSQVRGLIVAAGCIVFVWTFTVKRRTRFGFWTMGLVLVLVAVTGPGRTLWDRESVQSESANATTYRAAIFDEAVSRFQSSPTIGHGLGIGDRNLLIDVGKPGRKWATHSEVGTALAATGALGGLAIAAIYLTSFVACLRHFRRDGVWIPLAIISGMIVTIPVITWISRVSLLTLPFLFLVLPVALSSTPEPDQ